MKLERSHLKHEALKNNLSLPLIYPEVNLGHPQSICSGTREYIKLPS